MVTEANDSAFPRSYGIDAMSRTSEAGLTKREVFALVLCFHTQSVHNAVALADKLIEELNASPAE